MKLKSLQKIILIFLPVIFVFSLNLTKAETFSYWSNDPDSLNYTVTFSTDKASYNPNEKIIATINPTISYIDKNSNFHSAGMFSSVSWNIDSLKIKSKPSMSLIKTLQYNTTDFNGQMVDIPPIFCVFDCSPTSALQSTITPMISNPGTYSLETEIKNIFFSQVGFTLDCSNGCGGLFFGSGNSGEFVWNGNTYYYVAKTIPINVTVDINSNTPQIFVK